MKKEFTEVVFILDRSGSMEQLTDETIRGYNAMLEKQKEVSGEAIFSTVLFNHRSEVIHNRIPIREVPYLSRATYFATGTTALLDALGRSISKITRVHRDMQQDERPTKVLFVITTDGLENASYEYRLEDVRHQIIDRQERGWEFVFLGANFDAFAAAGSLGIRHDRTARYRSSKEGVRNQYETVNRMMSEFRVNPDSDKAFENLRDIKDDDDKTN